MQAIILKCPPSAQFRFGKAGLDVNSSLNATDSILHADTIFSAIINIANKCGGEVSANKMVKWFEEDRLQISSAFYCLKPIGGEDYIYLLPKPSCYEFFEADIYQRKKIRAVQFLSKKIWEEGIIPNWNKENYLNSKVILHTDEIKSLGQIAQLYKIQTRPRVTDQIRQPDNNLYFQTNLLIPKHRTAETHFYFLLKHSLNSVEYNEFLLYLEVLCDTGIGGRISLGSGKLTGFEVKENFQINVSQKHDDFQATLSLVAPQLNEINFLKHYQLITRGGRRLAGGNETEKSDTIPSSSRISLKRIKMLAEGAIVSIGTEGHIANISPANNQGKYLRYGKAFTIPIHQNVMKYDTNKQEQI